jgi:hypothetical protein
MGTPKWTTDLVLGAIVAAVGAVLAVLVGWRLNERSQHQAAAVETQRRHDDAQRDVLLRMQDHIPELIQAGHEIRRWRDRGDPDRASDAVRQLQAALQRSQVTQTRVTDTAAREAIDPVAERALDVRDASTPFESDTALNALGEAGHDAVNAIGAQLRTLL